MDGVLIFVLFFLLSIIIFYDIKKMYIPNSINIFFLIISILYKGFDYLVIEKSILGMALYPLPFLFIYGYLSDFLDKEVLGFGDIKLLFGIGYLLGYSSLIDIYIFFLTTFIFASIGGICIGVYKKNFKIAIPFAPYIILSFTIQLIKRYYL